MWVGWVALSGGSADSSSLVNGFIHDPEVRNHSLIGLAKSEVDPDDADIGNNQSNSESTPTNEVPVELLVRVPCGTRIPEGSQLDSVVIVESLKGMAAHL